MRDSKVRAVVFGTTKSMPAMMRASFGCLIAVMGGSVAGAASDHWSGLDTAQPLYVDRDNNDIHKTLPMLNDKDRNNALIIASFPSASWFSGGTPAQVQGRVATLVSQAATNKQLPVLVSYNLPFRDCQQYSAGGAANSNDYKAWIDGFAAGIGQQRAIVILEPDSLGIIPHYTNLAGQKEWCQPKELYAATAVEQRFEQLNHAVKELTRLPNVRVYLDGTHSRWLNSGDAADRLIRAGVLRTAGFYLNVANYYPTDELIHFGDNVSQCIHSSAELNAQAPSKQKSERLRNCASANASEAGRMHFVIDTSRNGRGPWTAPPGKYTDAQGWCNPPARGLGERPTLRTSHPLLDAMLWIKVPGESDGECTRSRQGSIDPERGMIDPPAGKWFKEQAAELLELASPPVQR